MVRGIDNGCVGIVEYRKTKEELLKIYEMNFGKWIIEHSDVSANGCFEWLKSPWPWENDNMEA